MVESAGLPEWSKCYIIVATQKPSIEPTNQFEKELITKLRLIGIISQLFYRFM